MSLLQKLTTGKTPSPPRILLYGDAGVGKSSFAATAPKPVILALEDGLDQVDCAKTPHIKDFGTFIGYLTTADTTVATTPRSSSSERTCTPSSTRSAASGICASYRSRTATTRR